jgi:hypothetical protein
MDPGFSSSVLDTRHFPGHDAAEEDLTVLAWAPLEEVNGQSCVTAERAACNVPWSTKKR